MTGKELKIQGIEKKLVLSGAIYLYDRWKPKIIVI